MALWTAQYRYSGTDRMDITAKANNIFSPPWKLVSAYKNAEARASLLPDKAAAEKMMAAAKLIYKDDFMKQLEKKINVDPLGVGGMIDYLNKHDLTMVCFCNVKKTGFCHRLLAAEYLHDVFGVIYNGERRL